ncbi:MAG: hypothetical protein ACRBF0_06930 [Calditrichia bacterium]
MERSQQTGSKCPEKFISQIDTYLRGDLDEAEIDEFEQTFFENDDCLKELQLRKDLRDLVKQDGKTLFPEFMPSDGVGAVALGSGAPVKAAPAKVYWPLSVAATVLCLVFFLVPDTHQKPLKLSEKANSFSAAFLSSQKDLRFRGSSYFDIVSSQVSRNQTIELLEPIKNYVYRGKLAFRWRLLKSGSNPLPALRLAIFTNKDQEILRANIIGGEFVLRNELEPGLYYWSLEDEEDTVGVGRFLVPAEDMIEE